MWQLDRRGRGQVTGNVGVRGTNTVMRRRMLGGPVRRGGGGFSLPCEVRATSISDPVDRGAFVSLIGNPLYQPPTEQCFVDRLPARIAVPFADDPEILQLSGVQLDRL